VLLYDLETPSLQARGFVFVTLPIIHNCRIRILFYNRKQLLTGANLSLHLSMESYYHFITALAQVKPLPKAAKTTVSPSFTLPSSQASQSAIGIEAAVVLPYF
jgi:hypothetical protein